jgi:hypothetical protein
MKRPSVESVVLILKHPCAHYGDAVVDTEQSGSKLLVAQERPRTIVPFLRAVTATRHRSGKPYMSETPQNRTYTSSRPQFSEVALVLRAQLVQRIQR